MGACGLDTRCCAAFLPDFNPISIKMAKEQGISLTPTEITGMCGRLRCCLAYEYEQYAEARKLLPKRGKRVSTPSGEGKVIEVIALKSAIVVEMDSGGQHEFSAQDVQLADDQEQVKKKITTVSEKPVELVKPGGKKRKPKGNE
jgi:cell fate regulator YaaT (PSP1 superfamily)